MTARPAERTSVWHRQGTQAFLGALGGFCGAVLGGALPAGRIGGLIGLFLGTSAPTLFQLRGRYQPLRVTAGIAVAALVVAFGSITAVDAAADRAPTLPLQPAAEDQGDQKSPGRAVATATPPGTGSTRPGGQTLEDDPPGIAVAPAVLRCTADAGCERPVTIENTGTAPLVLSSIDIAEDPGHAFRVQGDCNGPLAVDDECELTVTFAPTTADENYNALLVIQQNLLNEPPATVRLRGTADPVDVDLTRPEVTQCTYGAATDGAPVSQVQLSVRLAQPETNVPLPDSVRFRASIANGADDERDVSLDEAAAGFPLTIPFTPSDEPQTLTVSVDPDGAVDRQHPDDNDTVLSLTAPADVAAGTSCVQ